MSHYKRVGLAAAAVAVIAAGPLPVLAGPASGETPPPGLPSDVKLVDIPSHWVQYYGDPETASPTDRSDMKLVDRSDVNRLDVPSYWVRVYDGDDELIDTDTSPAAPALSRGGVG